MKLLTLRPFIFENSDEDDPFAEGPVPTGEALLNQLRAKAGSLQRQVGQLRSKANDMIREIPGSLSHYNYPSGWQQADNDIETGKILRVKSWVFDNTPQNEKIRQRVEEIEQRVTRLKTVETSLGPKIKRLAKSEAENQLRASRGQVAGSAQIPSDKIPRFIQTKNAQLTNPYFLGLKDRYAGDPKFFPWKPRELRHYLKLNELLKSNNLGEFTEIYASIVVKKGGSIPRLTFVAIGANGKVVWYRTGQGVWDSVVYANGYARHTEHLFDQLKDPKEVQQFVANIKKP